MVLEHNLYDIAPVLILGLCRLIGLFSLFFCESLKLCLDLWAVPPVN